MMTCLPCHIHTFPQVCLILFVLGFLVDGNRPAADVFFSDRLILGWSYRPIYLLGIYVLFHSFALAYPILMNSMYYFKIKIIVQR